MTDFRLRVFEAVARRMSFTRAAEELFLSQPAVTRHIHELEKAVGCRLFQRQGHRIELTPEGEKLLIGARRILREYSRLSDEIHSEDESHVEGELVLGASTTLAQYVLPSILAGFKRAYPSVSVSMQSGNTERIETMLEEGSAELGLVEGASSRQGLSYKNWLKDELVLVSGGRESLRNLEIPLDRLTKLQWVMREPGSGTRYVIEEALSGKGVLMKDLDILMTLGSSEGIKRYLKCSGACAFLSLFAVKDELTTGKLSRIMIKNFRIDRSFRFVRVKGDQHKVVDLFISFCERYDMESLVIT